MKSKAVKIVTFNIPISKIYNVNILFIRMGTFYKKSSKVKLKETSIQQHLKKQVIVLNVAKV